MVASCHLHQGIPFGLALAKPRHVPIRMNAKSWLKRSKKVVANRKASRKAVFRSRASEEASKPAAKHSTVVQNSKLKAMQASNQVMPPVIKGMARIGSTATQRVKARSAWASALPATIPPALSGVKNNKPSVPSRFSRAMQSAVSAGTIRKMSPSSKVWRPQKSHPPSCAADFCALAAMIHSTSVPTPALKKRSRWLTRRRAPSRSSRCRTGQTLSWVNLWAFTLPLPLVQNESCALNTQAPTVHSPL